MKTNSRYHLTVLWLWKQLNRPAGRVGSQNLDLRATLVDRRRDWIIAVRSGCLDILLTSSLQTNWCHLIRSIVLKHHWSRAFRPDKTFFKYSEHVHFPNLLSTAVSSHREFNAHRRRINGFVASASIVWTRTPPVDAALIPVTTPSQSLSAVQTRAPVPLSVCSWLADTAHRHRPACQPDSITGQPATPTTDSPYVTVTDTCGFNNSID